MSATGSPSGEITLPSTPLTFTNSNYHTTQSLSITVTEDADAVDERIFVTLTAAGSNYAGKTRSFTVIKQDGNVSASERPPVATLSGDLHTGSTVTATFNKAVGACADVTKSPCDGAVTAFTNTTIDDVFEVAVAAFDQDYVRPSDITSNDAVSFTATISGNVATITPTGITRTGGTDDTLTGNVNAVNVLVKDRYWSTDGKLVGRTVLKRFSLLAPSEDSLGPDPDSNLPAISVNDAMATEGSNAKLTFTVSLNRAVTSSDGTVSVDYATHDGTATAGADYTATSGTLSFAVGATQGTVEVPVLQDSHDDGGETLGFMLSNPVGAIIIDNTGVGTINNDDPQTEAWLSRFGRTVAEQVLDGVRARREAARAPGSMVSVAGQSLTSSAASPAVDEHLPQQIARAEAAGLFDYTGHGSSGRQEGVGTAHTLTLHEALRGASFAFTGGADGAGGTLALWGRAAESGFEGKEGSLKGDGDVTTRMVGVDYGRDDWLAGLVVSYTDADGDYSHAEGSGTITSKLTAATLYGVTEVDKLTELWGAAGYGEGDMKLKPKGAKTVKMDIDWTMVAAGMRSVIAEPAGSGDPTLALTADAMWANTESDKTGHHAKVEADVTRLRLGLEGSWATALEGGGSLTKTLELGMRHDEGDAETGLGMEAGGGIAWSNPSQGITIDLSGRTLVAHEESDFEDWGVSASFVIDPNRASDRGPSFTLRRELGGKAEGGLDALFAHDALERRTGMEAAGGWVAEASWGVPAYGGRFTGVPYAGLRTTDTSRDFTLGWRLALASPDATDFNLDITAILRENESAESGPGIGAVASFRW